MNVNDLDIETIRGWASTGFLGFIAFTLARFASPFAAYMTKRLEVKAQERQNEREGYGPLITIMQADIETVRKHHAECEERARHTSEEFNERLRLQEEEFNEARRADAARIATLEGQVSGLTRAISGISVNQGIELPSSTGNDRLLDIAERSVKASLTAIDRQRGNKDNG